MSYSLSGMCLFVLQLPTYVFQKILQRVCRCLCLEQALTTEDRNGCMQTVLVLPQSNQVDDNLCVYDVSPMMQLRRSDMLRLQRDTAAKYALMDSIEDAVVVFDIKMPHLPDGLKWLYVSRWLYLYLEPHTLGEPLPLPCSDPTAHG